MSEWKEYKLDDLVTKLGDGLHGTPKYDPNGEYYFINGSNLINGKISVNENTKKVTKEEFGKYKKELTDRTIFVSINGTLGNIATYNNEKVVLGKSACYFNIKEDVSKEFIKYIVTDHSFQHYIFEYATGSTIKNVPLKAIRDYAFKLPDLTTQTAIAEILSSLDDKIELNNKINQELENLAQTLFKQWFIDFEFPNENGEPYKSSGGEMVDSELGEIPKGWEVIPISDVFDFLSGYPFKGESFSKSGNYGIVTIKNVQDGKFVQDTDNFIDDLPNKFPKNAILNIGDILMSLTGNVGRVCFVTKENCVLNQRVVKFKGKQENSNAFWYYFFRQTLVKELLISISKGTAQLNLSPIETKSLKFVLPKLINENLLAAFTEIFNFEVACSIENIELTNLRDTLLPKLISGELEVSQIPTAS